MSTNLNIPSDINNPPKWIPVQSLQDRYQTISNLGNGSFGSVELAKFRLDKHELFRATNEKKGTLMYPLQDSQVNISNLVAIKTMNRQLPLLNDYTRIKEVRFIMAISSHPCLVQIYEIFIDDINFQLHISMESMNQNLYQLMKARRNINFSPVTLRSILSQVLCAIRHIHRHNYFHRDVKPENILVIPSHQYYGTKQAIPPYRKNDNFVIKLADYGLARHVGNTKPYTGYVSTRWYRSPEILLRQKMYSKPIDIWAFGAVACEVANFSPLFPGSNELDQIWRTLKVLGCPIPLDPHSMDRTTSLPMGGFWKDAHELASKLGFTFPPETGVQIQDILPNAIHAELAEVVRGCLIWDPHQRSTVERLCCMPYFRTTVAAIDLSIQGVNATDPTQQENVELPLKSVKATTSTASANNKQFKLVHNGRASKPISPINNVTQPSKVYSYVDLDDGYEKEFMKQMDQAEPITTEEEAKYNFDQDSGLMFGNDYIVQHGKENEGNFEVGYTQENQVISGSKAHYGSPLGEERDQPSVPRSLPMLKESLDVTTVLDLITDTSFDSSHEIDVNS